MLWNQFSVSSHLLSTTFKMATKWLVVGIAGSTCSGKSTLASQIHENIEDSIVIHQDDYFLPENDPRHTKIQELNHINWEILTSLDMKKMHSDIVKLISEPKNNLNVDTKKQILILDGFTLFDYKPISDLCNLKYFLTLTKEQCWERRKVREYNPPDVPGYFEKVVWPEYEKHVTELKADKKLYKTIKFLDGTKSQKEIFNLVFAEIKKHLY